MTDGTRWTAARRFSAGGVLAGWIAAGAFVLFTTQLCNTIWAFANPAPHHWDNADYLKLSYQDYWAYSWGGPAADPVGHPDVHRSGVRGVWDSLLHNDVNRPPGLRVVALPMVFLGTPMLASLRTVSLICFWITLWLVYRTVRTVVPGPAGIAAGIAAVIALSLDLEVGWAIRVFGTEYVLYLSIALMLYTLARGTLPEGRSHRTWMLLGLSLGMGMLSKVSFVTLAAPAGAVAMAMALTGQLPGLSPGRLFSAAGVGAAICYPYYRYHIYSAVKYGHDMTEFGRHSLNKSGTEFIHAWFSLHFNEGLGVGASVICILLTVIGSWAVVRWVMRNAPAIRQRRRAAVGPAGRVVILGLAAGLPLPLFQMIFSLSSNHRHITPAYFPLTVAAAVAAGASGVLAVWWSWPILLAVALPAAWQVRADFIPYTNTPDDVWDWDPLFRIIKDRKMMFPFIGIVGNGGQFNEPSVEMPWFARGDWAYTHWLWKPESGSYDWNKVRADLDAMKINVVVTAPWYDVRTDHSRLAEPALLENAHNQEFRDQMSALPGWEIAGTFPIGKVHKAEIWVYIRKPKQGVATDADR